MIFYDYDAQWSPGMDGAYVFPTFVLQWRTNHGQTPQPGKLTQPWIKPGPARWEATMLRFDHSNGCSTVVTSSIQRLLHSSDIIHSKRLAGKFKNILSPAIIVFISCFKSFKNKHFLHKRVYPSVMLFFFSLWKRPLLWSRDNVGASHPVGLCLNLWLNRIK